MTPPGPNDTSRPEIRYDFRYTERSTYARAARLLAANTTGGLVVDLGCGAGVLGVAAAEVGRTYLGYDTDADAIAAACERGIDARVLDLADFDAALATIRSDVAGRRVSAVCLLDVIEHLPAPDRVLADLARLVDALGDETGSPLLIVSIPNVTHADLGAKLVTGRWDVTEVGLLDDTHITLFTEERLDDVMAGAGFVEIAAEDNVHDRTEQEFPTDHPAIGRVTVLARFLRSLRRRSGPGGETYQFVRCYRRAGADEAEQLVARARMRPSGRPDDPMLVHPGPFLSVIVRTQGARSTLVETLTTLAAQTDDDLEVLVVVHQHDDDRHDDRASVRAVEDVVDSFDPRFADRVRVEQVSGAGRGRPLNAALRVATGRYVAILDDDDLVTADWVERFRSGADAAPGTVVRAPCVLQWTERSGGVVRAVTGFEAPYPVRFDYLDHVRRNRSPSCSYAVPTRALTALGVTVDEDLQACEDWKYLMDVVRWTGVTDVSDPTATSIYRRSRDGAGADGVVSPERWAADHLAVAHHIASEPSLVPAGSLLAVRHLYEALERADEAMVAMQNRIDALERSRVWRVTAGLRSVARLRRVPVRVVRRITSRR